MQPPCPATPKLRLEVPARPRHQILPAGTPPPTRCVRSKTPSRSRTRKANFSAQAKSHSRLRRDVKTRQTRLARFPTKPFRHNASQHRVFTHSHFLELDCPASPKLHSKLRRPTFQLTFHPCREISERSIRPLYEGNRADFCSFHFHPSPFFRQTCTYSSPLTPAPAPAPVNVSGIFYLAEYPLEGGRLEGR
jgi:hypothetical protein